MAPSDEPGTSDDASGTPPAAADPQPDALPGGSRWPRRLAIGLAVALVLHAAGGFLVLPRIVASQLKRFAVDTIGIEPTIGAVHFDPFDARLVLESVALEDPALGGEALAFESLVIDVALLRLLVGRVAFEEVALRGPSVSVILDESGRLNLMALVPDTGEAPGPEREGAEQGTPLEITIDALELRNGVIRFVDQGRTPAFSTELGPIDLTIDGFTTRGGVESPGELSFVFGEAGELHWDGRFSLDPLQSTGALELASFDLRLPAEAFAPRLRFEIAAGRVDASLRYVLGTGSGLSLEIDEGRIALADLSLRDRLDDLEVLSLPRVDVEDLAIRVEDAALASLAIGDVGVDGGALRTRLEANGALHVAELLRPVNGDEGDPASVEEAGADASGEGRPAIHVERIGLSGFAVAFEDRRRSPSAALVLESVDATVSDYDNTPGQPLGLDLSLRTGAGGALGIEGSVTPDPLSLDLSARADAFVITPLESWIQSVARVGIPSGRLEADLRVGLATGGGVSVSGRGELAGLSVVDRFDGAPLLDVLSLRIEDLDYSPERLAIEEVGLAGLRARAVLRADGTTTLASILPGGAAREAGAARRGKAPGGPGEEVARAAASGSGPRIEVARVRLEELAGVFIDRSFDPPVQIGLENLGGRIDGLTSDTDPPAEVELAGSVDGVAPLRVSGRVAPLARDLFADLALDLQGLPLPTLGAYARRHLGLAVERGNLGLDLDYRIEARHVRASNRVSIEGLEFGERVESEQATQLPVRLALAVLRDARGHVEITLPIEGDLDDPGFDLFALLRDTAVNLVTRVATAPFAAIASVAGLVGASGEDLSRVAFAAGSTAIDEQERRELEELAGVLADRTALRLEIRGRADPSAEAAALRRVRLREEIRRRVEGTLPGERRAAPGEGAEAGLDPAAELAGLSTLYAERLGGDLRDRIPPAARPPRGPERTQALIEAGFAALAPTVELDKRDWQALARGRAAAIRAVLLATRRVAPERLDLVDVEIGPVAEGNRIPSELALTAD